MTPDRPASPDPYGPHQANHQAPSSDLTVSLHHHFDRRFDELEKRMDDRFAAQEKATNAAMIAAEKAVLKAEGLADIRANEQDHLAQERNHLASRMLSREEYALAHASLVEKIDILSGRLDKHEGRGLGASATWVWLFIGVAGVVSIAGLLLDLLLQH